MKRINPDTGKPFVRFDKRPSTDKQDGKVFNVYTHTRTKKHSNGFFYENWEKEETIRINSKKHQKKKFDKGSMIDLRNVKKRKSKNTNALFFKGDYVDGKYFGKYLTQPEFYDIDEEKKIERKYYKELWLDDKKEFLEYFMKELMRQKKAHCKNNNIEFDLDKDYLLEIYPEDEKCPISKNKFVFGRPNINRPELDRMNPKKGYIKGNVAFISRRMNTHKSDLTAEELFALYNYSSKAFEVTKIK